MRTMKLTLTIICLAVAGGLMATTQTLAVLASDTQGTSQMAGEWAEMGKEYTINPNDPMNFTLRSAEFLATRIKIGNEIYYPKGDEKFLVLHYTIHNPQDSEKNATWNTFDFTAVDATNENREYSQYVGQEDNSLEIGNIDLKPAQEIKAYTFIIVPAKGVIPKLIVKRGDAPVLRFDLKGKVTPLAAPYADPSDPTGCTALKEVPAVMGTWYPTGRFDIRLDSASYTNETYVEYAPEEGRHHLLLNVTIKNPAGAAQNIAWSTFNPEVKVESGEKIEYNQNLLHSKRDEVLNADLDPDQEIKARFFFQVYTDDPAAKFIILDGYDEGNRKFVFDVSSVK